MLTGVMKSSLQIMIAPSRELCTFSDKFSRADLAAALLTTTVMDLVQSSIAVAQSVQCRHVVVCGSFVSHPHVRRLMTTRFIVSNALASQVRGAPPNQSFGSW